MGNFALWGSWALGLWRALWALGVRALGVRSGVWLILGEMSRPLRLEHSGAIWHVTSRGNERRDVFRDEVDREKCFSGGVTRIQ